MIDSFEEQSDLLINIVKLSFLFVGQHNTSYDYYEEKLGGTADNSYCQDSLGRIVTLDMSYEDQLKPDTILHVGYLNRPYNSIVQHLFLQLDGLLFYFGFKAWNEIEQSQDNKHVE